MYIPKGSPLAVRVGGVPAVAGYWMLDLIDVPEAAVGRPEFDFTSVYVRPKTLGGVLMGGGEQVVAILRRDQSALLRRLLDATTIEEFVETRREIARPYWRLSESIRNVVGAHFSAADWAQLARGSVDSLIADFERLGVARIGPDATEEAIFSISTLGKVPRVLLRVIELTRKWDPHPNPKRHDELLNQFVAYTLICELHLHLLVLMITGEGLHIRPFALRETLIGLRSSVAMYGAIREAASLVRDRDETLEADLILDDEDRDLLEASARDASHTLHTN